jgi:tetratricopeptide (TPR) repeat protein
MSRKAQRSHSLAHVLLIVAFSGCVSEREAKTQPSAGVTSDSYAVTPMAPIGVSGYTIQGEAKSDSGDYAGALADFNTAIAKDPRNIRALLGRAGTKNAMGDYQGAILNLNEIISIDPEDPRAWFMRGYAKRQLHDLDGFNFDTQRGAERRDAFVDNMDDEGLHWLDDGNDAEALYAFTEAIKMAPNQPRFYNNRAFVECREKQFDAAIADLNSAANFPAVWVVQAWLRTKSNDPYGAMALYNQAIGSAPRLAPLYFDRSTIWSALGNFNQSITDLNKAIELDPTEAVFFNARGKAKLKIRDFHGASADFGCAVKLNPDLDEARANMQVANNASQ